MKLKKKMPQSNPRKYDKIIIQIMRLIFLQKTYRKNKKKTQYLINSKSKIEIERENRCKKN